MSDALTEEQEILRNKIVSALKQGVVSVLFTKVDGTRRNMRCSLHESHLPPKPDPDPSTPLPPRPKRPATNIVVWDVDNGGWRSFRLNDILMWHSEN